MKTQINLVTAGNSANEGGSHVAIRAYFAVVPDATSPHSTSSFALVLRHNELNQEPAMRKLSQLVTVLLSVLSPSIGCGGADPVPPELLGRWIRFTVTCDCDASDPPPVQLMDLRTDSATLSGVDNTLFDVSAESDGEGCVAFGSGIDGYGRDIDATTLCVDTAGDLRGAVVAHSDDGEGTWYYSFRHQ